MRFHFVASSVLFLWNIICLLYTLKSVKIATWKPPKQEPTPILLIFIVYFINLDSIKKIPNKWLNIKCNPHLKIMIVCCEDDIFHLSRAMMMLNRCFQGDFFPFKMLNSWILISVSNGNSMIHSSFECNKNECWRGKLRLEFLFVEWQFDRNCSNFIRCEQISSK